MSFLRTVSGIALAALLAGCDIPRPERRIPADTTPQDSVVQIIDSSGIGMRPPRRMGLARSSGGSPRRIPTPPYYPKVDNTYTAIIELYPSGRLRADTMQNVFGIESAGVGCSAVVRKMYESSEPELIEAEAVNCLDEHTMLLEGMPVDTFSNRYDVILERPGTRVPPDTLFYVSLTQGSDGCIDVLRNLEGKNVLVGRPCGNVRAKRVHR